LSETVENILLIAGSGRNVGKTTLACKILQQEKEKKPVAVKITPHFHEPSPGLVTIDKGNGWIIFEETSATTGKDSSLFLKHGASKSFFIQTQKKELNEAFLSLRKILPENSPVVIESAALFEIVRPGFFAVVLPAENCRIQTMETRLALADLIVINDGKRFYPPPEKIVFTDTWQII
jgi:hypothetical protein